MPQNKSTSRIAAVAGKLAVALAVLLAPAILIAETINVTFDAALTNETGWVYDTGFEYVSTQKKYGFKSGNKNLDQIISPVFDFAVTSVVINAEKASNKTTRKMSIRATSGNAAHNAVELVDGIIPPDQVSFTITNIWDKSDGVHSFSLLTTGGSGSLYLTGAVISGVLIIDAPTNLQADDIKGTRFRLSWTNPENAVSNCVEVSSVQLAEPTGTTVEEFGFDEISAGGNAVNFAKFRDLLPPHYEKLSGTNLYAATNSTGLLQISTGKDRGELVYSGYEAYTDLTLKLTLKRYGGDANTMTIAWTDGGATTNSLETINLADDFITEFINLSSVTDGARIVFNNSGNDDTHRVIIDEIAFIRDYVPAHAETNLVKTAFVAGSTTYSVRGLCPRTEYIARISAFDAEGNESSPSEPLAVTTNGEAIPFSIRIQ